MIQSKNITLRMINYAHENEKHDPCDWCHRDDQCYLRQCAINGDAGGLNEIVLVCDDCYKLYRQV